MTTLTKKRKIELIEILWDYLERDAMIHGDGKLQKSVVTIINLLADNYLVKINFGSARYYDLHNICTNPFVKKYLQHDITIDEYAFMYDYISDKINARLKNKKYDRKK